MVRYERLGAAAVVTIDRPERRNAVDGATATELLAAYERFAADEDARVMVLTGAGEQAFCAGADLKALETLDADAPAGPMGFTRVTPAKPAIAAIRGWCVAGGLELAVWCDLRVASRSARFGCLERRWGVPLIDGGTQRLPRIVGLGRALDLILTGREIDADEALAMGLVERLVDEGSALPAAVELASEIASKPWGCVVSDRRCVYEGLGRPLDEGLANEDRRGREVIFAEGFAAGVARFTEGRR
jgi:enoyl-CoA hydratase